MLPGAAVMMSVKFVYKRYLYHPPSCTLRVQAIIWPVVLVQEFCGEFCIRVQGPVIAVMFRSAVLFDTVWG